MKFQKNKNISDVYFSGSFSHHKTNEKKGRKTSVNKNFTKDGKIWYVPAYYTCPKGIVIDVAVTTPIEKFNEFADKWCLFDEEKMNSLSLKDTEKAEQENPLNNSFSPELIKNNRHIHCCHMQSTVYLPFNAENKEAKKLARLYKLNENDCHTFYRICFQCSTKNPIASLSLRINASKERITAAEFSIKENEEITITHPITSLEYSLKAVEITEESMDFGKMPNQNTRFPCNFCILKFSLTPELDNSLFKVSDTENSDPPEKIAENTIGFIPDSSVSVAIIGGADGPTVMFAGPPVSQNLHTACSALKHKKQKKIVWKFDFIEKTKEDKTLIIKETSYEKSR